MARERAEITKSAKKITKRIFAIEAAESAIPPNPRTPAIMATIRLVDSSKVCPESFRDCSFQKACCSFDRCDQYLFLSYQNIIEAGLNSSAHLTVMPGGNVRAIVLTA